MSPIDYSTAYPVELGEVSVAVNIAIPLAGKRFVITDLSLFANKNVGVGDATVEIYEATAIDTLVVSESVFKTEMLKQTNLPLTGLNLIVTEGKYLNCKTNDDDIFVNVFGYYVPV